MTTAYNPTVAELRNLAAGPLGDLVLVLACESGITVRGGHIDAVQCEWCGDVGAVTTVRINGRPRDSVLLPVETEEVCGTCAPPIIRRAVAEADVWADDIVIEVAA